MCASLSECALNTDTACTPQAKRPLAFSVTQNAASSRKRSPTQIDNEGKGNLPRRSLYNGNLETLQAASEIHGGTVEDRSAALTGMFTTLVKYADEDLLLNLVKKTSKFKNAIRSMIKKETKKI